MHRSTRYRRPQAAPTYAGTDQLEGVGDSGDRDAQNRAVSRFFGEFEKAVDEVERCLQELRLRNRILEATGHLELRHLDELRNAYERLNEITTETRPSLFDD
jgi:hypothetical protein